MRKFGAFVSLGCAFLLPVYSDCVRAADLALKAPAVTAQSVALGGGWEATLDEDTRYYSWRSSRPFPATTTGVPGKGYQVYVPFGLDITGKLSDDWKLEFLTRSGHVTSRQSTSGTSGTVSTFTDTTVSGTATYLGLNGFQPYVSLAVNAPTGKSALSGTEPNARLDPDMVALGTFGEGWNIGPTFGVTIIASDDFILDFSGGYTARGSYLRDGMTNLPTGLAAPSTPPNGISNLSPGDLTSFSSNIAYRWNSITFRATASYNIEQTTFVNGGALYKAGDRVYAALTASYDWANNWNTTIGGNWTHQDRQKVFNTAFFSPLVLEALDSNNDLYTITLDHRFKWEVLSFGPTASYLVREQNSWNPFTLTFVPAKTMWSAGGAAEAAVNSSLSFNGRLEYRWASQDPTPFSGIPSVSSTGWLASLGGTVKF